MQYLNLCFVIEVVTDVRLIEGLAERFNLTLVYRQSNRSMISQPTTTSYNSVAGPSSRAKFATFVWNYLRKRQNEFNYVIVQNYSLTAIAANLAAIVSGTPTAMLVCSPVEAYYRCRKLYGNPDKPFRYYELVGIKVVAYINAVLGKKYLTLSQYLVDTISSYGIKKPVQKIPLYGVDTSLFSLLTTSKVEIKAKLGLPLTGSIIFFSSRIAPEKDSETLLIAVSELLKEGRDIWLLHRSGSYREFLKDAEQHGVAHRVIATDAVHPHKELPFDYQASDLCIQSSREEGLGFSPLEALACGTPVIASAVGGLKETIIDNCTGWTYPVGNSRVLAECIKAVLDFPDEANKRALRGRDLVCTVYNRQIVFNELYMEVVSVSSLE